MSGPLTGFWIKSHSAILEDVTIATLPDTLWRRYHELKHLLAHDSTSGDLPSIKAIAFRLRVSEEQLLKELEELTLTSLVSKGECGYQLPFFVKEQEADSEAERKRRQREKALNSKACHDVVTKRDTERVEENIADQIEKAEKEPSQSEAPAASALVKQLTKVMTADLAEEDTESPDEAFWERMKTNRPDLSMNQVREKMESYCRNERLKITRSYAEAWVKREKTPLQKITPPPEKPKVKVDERDALRWRSEIYPDSAEIHPTALDFPFAKWPKQIQKEYLESKKVLPVS